MPPKKVKGKGKHVEEKVEKKVQENKVEKKDEPPSAPPVIASEHEEAEPVRSQEPEETIIVLECDTVNLQFNDGGDGQSMLSNQKIL